MSIVKSTLSINSTGAVPSALNFSRSSSATRVNAIGQVETVAANTIRQDYYPNDVGRLMGWLLEESSTNNCLQSEAFDNASWITGTALQTNAATITADQVKSPDGTNSADLLASSSATTGIVAARQQGFTFTNGSTYTISVWAKKKELNFLEISNKDNDAAGRTFSKCFNLNTGALGTSGGTVGDASITSYPNNWYRCTVTFTADASSDSELYLKARSDDGVNTTYAFGSGEGIYLWGAQVEEQPYATSYVPTTTVPVTRNADVAYIEDTEGLWNWDVGASIWVDAIPLSNNSTQPIYHYQDATNNNYFTLLSDGKVKIAANGNNQLDSDPFDTGLALTKDEHFRNCMAIKSNRFHLAQNGSLSPNLPDTTIMVPLNSSGMTYTIKFFHGSGLTSGSGWLSNVRIYSNVLTDTELQNITFRKNDDASSLAINAVQVVDGSISTLKLANDAVTSAKILDGTIQTGDIAAGGIETANIGDDQITQAKIAAGAVGGTEIANNSITSAHLGLDVIVAEDIANNAITVAELANNAVSTDKLQAGAVDGTKIALGSDAAGDIMYFNGTSWTRLPKGSSGELLTQGTSAPEWAADPTDVGGTSVGGDVTGTVSNIQIAANAVGANEIAANSVGASEIIQNSVGITELNVSDGTAGQLLSTDGSGNLSFISDPTNVGATSVGGDLSGSVANAQIVAGAVGETELADDAVTANKLASNAVVTASIVDANVTTGKLADDAVTADKLADHGSNDALRAVGEDHIKIGAVTNTKLGADAVDGSKIADDSINSEHYVDGSIDTAHIGDNQVTNAKIAALAVGNSQLAANAVTTNKVADNQITIAKLAVTDGTAGQILSTDGNGTLSFVDDTDTTIGDASVGGDVTGTISNIQIAAGAVDTTELADGSVTNAKLAANSITSDKILLDVIVAEDLAANSVTFSELQDGAVRTAKIQDNAVTGAKIAMGSDAAGDVLYYNGTDYARLAAGTAGQVLKMNSGATAPEWAADIDTTIGDASVGGDVSGTISNIQLSSGVVGTTELADNSVTGAKIALGSDAAGDVMYYNGTDYVRLAKGTAGQVLKMNSGATAPEWAADIDTTIGDAAVGGDVTGTISNITIPNNTITSAMIAPGVIVAQDIATNAVNGTHIAMGSDVAGDILYYNGTDYTRLGAGTAGQVLTMNSGANAPEWAADSTNVSGTAVGGMMSGTVGNISINAGVVTPTMLSATGTADSTTFLRGDGQWATPAGITSESDPTAVTMAIALG